MPRKNRVAPEPSQQGAATAAGFQDEREEIEKEGVKPPRVGRRFFRYSNPWRKRGERETAVALVSGSACNGESSSSGKEEGEEAVDATLPDPAHSLLGYFTQLARHEVEEIDFSLMESLLQEGADINATWEASECGQTVLHEVAANWGITVAEFLIGRGADIHCLDARGRTPLHIASSTDHRDMVECLLAHGADINQCSHSERQTAIHYAARGDSLNTLELLIQYGGDYETRDYKGRTPLHLAAELDRTTAAEYLLSLDNPAECRVSDNAGNPALVSMIRTMPKVALLALDQLHQVASADRKQYFLLSHLEPEPGNTNAKGVKTPFEITVEEERYDILTHIVMRELIEHKWKIFVRFHFFVYSLLYVVFLLSWTLLIAYPSAQEKHRYIFPRDLWRVFFEVVAMGTYLHQMVEEVLELVRSRWKHKHYTQLRSRNLCDDLDNTDCSLPEERKYLEAELARASKAPPGYFRDPWNVVDVVTFVVLFVLVILHCVDIAAHTHNIASGVGKLSCVAVILIWVRLLKHARGIKSIGPLIAIISHLIGDIIKFFILFAIFYIPYVVCFWVIFGDGESATVSLMTNGSGSSMGGVEVAAETEDLVSFHRVAIMLFRMSLVDDYPYRTLRTIDEPMTALLVISFLLIIAVVGLNLFIALLSDTFQRVYDNAQANAEMQKARIILSLEEKASRCWRERYLHHIHANCSPTSRYYDDDDTINSDKTPSQLQKITHQIHGIVSSLQMERSQDGDQHSREVELLRENMNTRLEQQEEAILHVNQHLAEISNILFAMQKGGASHTPIRSSPMLEGILEETQLVSNQQDYIEGATTQPSTHQASVENTNTRPAAITHLHTTHRPHSSTFIPSHLTPPHHTTPSNLPHTPQHLHTPLHPATPTYNRYHSSPTVITPRHTGKLPPLKSNSQTSFLPSPGSSRLQSLDTAGEGTHRRARRKGTGQIKAERFEAKVGKQN